MRSGIAAAVVFLPLVLAAGAFAGDGACSGDACAALSLSTDGCSWTNRGDKSVRLAVTVVPAGGDSAKTSPTMTILAAGETFKEPAEQCAKLASYSVRYAASYPTLAAAPEETPAPVKVALPKPKPKPAAPVVAAAPAVAPAVTPVAMPASAPAPVAPAVVAAAVIVPVPRAKPVAPRVYPPLPRLKPEVPVEVASATAPTVGAAAVVAPAAVAPTIAVVDDGKPRCGEACAEILFTVVDSCLWVQSQNPRAISFEATIGGKPIVLALEGADGAKADVRAAVLAKAGADVAKGDSAYHTRLHDPFQSAGPGIPVYRKRLGAADSCVKSRDEIASFTARFVK